MVAVVPPAGYALPRAVALRRVFEHCSESGSLLFPTHFGAPHVATIASAGGGFSARFVEGAPGDTSR